MPVLFPLMANLASNDVMQRHNDALHSQAFVCPLSSLEKKRYVVLFHTDLSVGYISPSIHADIL